MIRTIYKRMKIVVSIVASSKGDKHLIQVVDDQTIVYSETATTIEQRDKTVWQLAETYNALDIEVNTSKLSTKKTNLDSFKFSEIPCIPVLDEQDAIEFFNDNEGLVYNRIVQAVEEGLTTQQSSIRLFELNGTGVYFTSESKDWKRGLEKAIDYFVSVEEYERCITCKQLLSKL